MLDVFASKPSACGNHSRRAAGRSKLVACSSKPCFQDAELNACVQAPFDPRKREPRSCQQEKHLLCAPGLSRVRRRHVPSYGEGSNDVAARTHPGVEGHGHMRTTISDVPLRIASLEICQGELLRATWHDRHYVGSASCGECFLIYRL